MVHQLIAVASKITRSESNLQYEKWGSAVWLCHMQVTCQADFI